jgi:hypothetical protein
MSTPGAFGGAKAYFEGAAATRRADGVMIGYPGLDHVVTGGRGVLRARVHVRGTAGHSGSSRPSEVPRHLYCLRPDQVVSVPAISRSDRSVVDVAARRRALKCAPSPWPARDR